MSGYKSAQFQMHDYMPLDIDIKRLSDGDSIEETLIRHSASSYKACCVKFSQTKLDRLEKTNKKSSNEGIELLYMQRRSSQECFKGG